MWRSMATWPHPLGISTDRHKTKSQAEAVCEKLKKDGFGGNGKIFPITTHVNEIFEVVVTRTSCASSTFEVVADDIDQAHEMALELAYNHDFGAGSSAEYKIG